MELDKIGCTAHRNEVMMPKNRRNQWKQLLQTSETMGYESSVAFSRKDALPGMQKRILTLLFIVSVGVACSPAGSDPTNGASEAELYGNTQPHLYLSGQFDPYSHVGFTTLEKAGIPASRKGMVLRKETTEALKKMLFRFKKDHPNIRFWVQSATRPFNSQKGIWEAKWNGQRKVSGMDLRTIKDPLKRARMILEYSSMPGTSRHHWGTDFDINSLNPAYYRSGTGKIIYEWMLANAPDFGFCLVYTEGRDGGYQWEPWHWSYRPLSAPMLRDWNRLYDANKIRTNFSGSDAAFHLAPEYVNTIGAACK
ncbi:MAG TPA: peptidase M15 [Leptospiraceae bacterium]|nr:peptidase M15 [Spirochaetaceae bacterium]HBS06055.1 peptidase M15 [Leptospiraceae bacterium]